MVAVRVNPQSPLWARQLVEEINRVLNQNGPVRAPSYTTANMPSAAEYKDHIIKNSTLNILCVSDGTDWIRQDTGAAV